MQNCTCFIADYYDYAHDRRSDDLLPLGEYHDFPEASAVRNGIDLAYYPGAVEEEGYAYGITGRNRRKPKRRGGDEQREGAEEEDYGEDGGYVDDESDYDPYSEDLPWEGGGDGDDGVGEWDRKKGKSAHIATI